ncbi:TPA: ead/Ea22-like family protein [Escherichia coli]|nr:ead/Ea22-like family protein [Escherichia coli]
MSKIDYQAMREKAEKATCGEWSLEYGEGRFDGDDALIHREVAGYIPICRIEGAHPESGFDEDFQMEQQANAEFIAAANPATVLTLLGELETAKKRIAELEAEPVSQAYNLPELIEGMEVSIDVSTCDADLGNRYFGTVTEALELDTAKNGHILLVQDAEPNFDVNGNSPVTPDGWISCSERMPEIRQTVIGWNGYAVRQCVYTRNEYAKTQKGREPRFETLTGIWHGVTHWMPLPEPPQEVNRG